MSDERLMKFSFLEGKWIALLPDGSGEPVREYVVKQTEDGISIDAKDLIDDEPMRISDIKWDGEALTFKSLVPSTGRTGLNEFTYKPEDGVLQARFIFTILENLKRKKTERKKGSAIEGCWVSSDPHESDDYLTEYIIERNENGLDVSAKDMQDEEKMEIFNSQWNGKVLSFESYMPSTERSGHVQFRLKENDEIEAKFQFTIVEELRKSL